ncbi:asparagine synthetase B family protein [Thermomonas sp.]
MNREVSPPATGSVTGDFVLALGPGSRAWLSGLPGFRLAAQDGEAMCLAVRGAATVANPGDGCGWMAVSDLVEGELADGVRNPQESPPQRHWRGRFAQLAWDGASGTITAFTDHFASVPIYWYRSDRLVAVASDLRLLLSAPGCMASPDPEAIYHYLNFACIPAPLTICKQVRKIEPGTRLQLSRERVDALRYYLPEYPEDLDGSDDGLADELRERIITSVRDFRPSGMGDWGCFLSGGTDSSSVVTILARQKPGRRVRTCSIGFAEAGYDELKYARIAADACNAEANFDHVDRARAMHLLDAVITDYDQPFGNASAIPTLACAGLGTSLGMATLLAGDGGDEIFGGNQRYAKDKLMGAFHALPRPARRVAGGLAHALGGRSSFFLNRLRNFTERASLPNPDRFYTDDSFASDHYDELLTPEFRAQVMQGASLDLMRRLYAQGGDCSELHRLMRLDLQMAIAQNDLVKVHGGCKAHGITARFPYLDPTLVDFTGRLAARHKLRGLDKRYLFKRAMHDILPEEIRRKPKQGFGLPVAVWLRHDQEMQSLARSVLLDDTTQQRGWIQRACVEHLLDRHVAGAWDHSAPIWQLLILELWMRRHMDGA